MADSATPEQVAWHSLPPEEVERELGVESGGLSLEEVALRQEKYGPNRLGEQKKEPAWKLFLAQYQDFMIYVLLVAVVISAAEGQLLEASAILAILLLNGVLGFVQEYRAEQALEALKDLSAPTATVIRNGNELEIKAEELVPGDIVLLEAGDRIPADGRLLETASLQVVESALTGESEPVRKDTKHVSPAGAPLGDRRNMVFASTAVAVGRGRYVVTATAQQTEMGKIANLLAGTKDEATPIEDELEKVGRRIAIIVLVIAAIVFFEEVFLAVRADGGSIAEAVTHDAFRENLTAGLLIAVSLAVAAIPEGLPAIVTVALSLGVRRMAQHNAVVRKLHAVETLGSTSFICSDKTGTLTMNKMTARYLVVGTDQAEITEDWGIDPEDRTPHQPDVATLLTIAAACNDAHFTLEGELVGDPTETALIVAAEKLLPGHLKPKRLDEIPFDSTRKRMTTVHRIEQQTLAYTKGGTDVVLDLCDNILVQGHVEPLDSERRAELDQINERLASQGYRTLAFSMRDLPEDFNVDDEASIESGMTLVGILGLVDPPRREAEAAIRECRRAGIRVAMVTGDHALTAKAIASQVGLDELGRLMTGEELEGMSDERLRDEVETISVYARVNPEHKLRIVDALKFNGEVVAMTGDGVNDAPALKRADIGVAMGLVGTDVAREAADMVLADDNFATVVEAVAQGRTVFDNLRKVILFLLSCNMSEVLVVAITALFSPTAALLPLQLLWINLVTDGLPALALGVDPADPDVMSRQPRDVEESILTGQRQLQVLWHGSVMTAGVLVLGYLVAPMLNSTDGAARTMIFTALVLTQLLHSFNFRSATRSVFSSHSFANKWLLMGLFGSMTLQIAVVYLPGLERIFQTDALNGIEWLAIVLTAIVAVAVIDASKLIMARRSQGR